MAINKRKVLDAARKYAQKGAKQKALKEYNQLIALDPRDAKLLLEVGDAYRRWGQVEEAIAQYTKVAAQYKQDGFDARAVAVFKQILNLDPKRYTAYVSLSELYQRMGLDGEAIGALQTAADGYHKEGRKREALELLRRMAALDPSNTTSRMKVADLLKQEGMEQDAVAEYEEVIAELQRQGAQEQAIPVYERILEIKPKRVDTLVSLSGSLCDAGRPELAEPFALRALEASEEPEQYELLCGIYRSLGNDERLAQTTRNLAKLYRQRGDEDRAREILQRLPAESAIDSGGLGLDPTPGGEPPDELADDELLDDEFLMAEDAGGLLGSEEDEIELEETIAAERPADDVEEEPLPEGDPDQLFAEATVYLRYGKREQAIASLKGILLHEPGHRGALEKLGEAHAGAGETKEAVAIWRRAAEAALEAGDSEAFGIIRDRIAALDPAAAADLPAPDSDDGVAAQDEAADEIEIDLGDDETELSREASEQAAPEDEAANDADVDFDVDVGLDVDVDAEVDLAAGESPDSAAGSRAEAVSATDAAPLGESFDIDIDTSEFEIDAGDGDDSDDASAVEHDDASVDSQSQAGQSSASAARIQEELEEAEFYVQQGLADEAEAVYRRILSTAPNHPAALLRLGELAAARGDDPSGAGLTIDEEDGGTTLEDKVEGDTASAVEADADIDTTESIDLAGDLAEEFARESGEVDATDPGLADEEPSAAAARESRADSGQLFDDTLPLSARDSEATFDLAAELADAFEEDDEASSDAGAATGSVLSTVEDGFESIFADFKKGVTATLDAGDYETRYDLGIAYREMELFDDAIAEFRVCLDCPTRRFDSLYMMGLCAFGLGRYSDAVNHLEQALAMGEVAPDRQAGVYFDLGRAYEAGGDSPRARSAYERVGEIAAGFPGLADRLAALDAIDASGSGAPAALQQDGDLESFGDFMADLAAEDDENGESGEMGEAESFESFDDVITEFESSHRIPARPMPELEPVPDEDEIMAGEIVEEEPDPQPAARSERSGKKPPRKKRISFV